ncbi:MAG: YDG domain-containing protein [Clostridiales bacterium]|jgi:hypothetical protein|nr:YDG domain-containing protein [Clostridiales bacterium]
MKKTKVLITVCVFFAAAVLFFLPFGMLGADKRTFKVEYVNAADTDWYDATEERYYIDNIAELQGLAEIVNGGESFYGKEIYLSYDIETATSFTIGNAQTAFSGNFFGNGNKIKTGAPLFFSLNQARIQNLFIEADFSYDESSDMGILTIYAIDSIITETDIKVKYVCGRDGGRFGAYAAYAENTVIENCSVRGVIKKVGGTTGAIAADTLGCLIKNCYVNVDITATYVTGCAVGGIVGRTIDTNIVQCVSYSGITLRDPWGEEIAVSENAGMIVGNSDALSTTEKCYYLMSVIPPAGGGTAADAEVCTSEEFKSREFLDMLNEYSENMYIEDIIGYEINDGYPIFEYQSPRPVAEIKITGKGFVTADGEIFDKNIKVDFGAAISLKINADAYYTITYAAWNGQSIDIADGQEIAFVTEAIYERSSLVVVFEREMREIKLDGISASKVYDGTNTVKIGDITFGESGLYISNKYFENDDIYIINDFLGDDPIVAFFGYVNAGVNGQYLELTNVKFGGAALEYYTVPDSFKIYGAEILKAELIITYGDLTDGGDSYTAGIATAVYGDEITDGKHYGFSVNDPNFLLYGELFVEVLFDGQFRKLERGEIFPVGEYILRAGGVYARNYNITFAECRLTVSKRQLFIGFRDTATEYGTLPEFSYTYENFARGDDEYNAEGLINPDLGGIILTASNKPYEIALIGGSAKNYEIINVKGKLTVTKKEIKVWIDLLSKTYGDEDPPLTGYSEEGFCYDDKIYFKRNMGEDVGEYGYSGFIIEGNGYDATNCYEVKIQNPNERFKINKKRLDISIPDTLVTFGRRPDYRFVFDGLAFDGDADKILNLDVKVYLLTDSGFENPLNIADKFNVGSYAIKSVGGINNNYDIYHNAGKLSVEKAELTVTIKDNSITYGGVLYSDYEISGFAYDENASVVGGYIEFFVDGAERIDAGEYALLARGFFADNYSFIYVAGRLTVEKALLSITILYPVEITYGENLVFEYAFDGFVNGDDINALTVLKTEYLIISELQNVMPYAESKNYEFLFFGNTLKLNKRTLTLSGLHVADKLYDGKNTALLVGEPILKGGAEGDDLVLSGELTALFDYVSAGIMVPVTVYGGTVEGRNVHMYDFVMPKLYGNICVNSVVSNGIMVVSGAMLPYDSMLFVEILSDFKDLKKSIRKSIGSREVKYAINLRIASDSAVISENGKYTVYIPLDMLPDKNLDAIIIGGGRYTEVKTRIENNYLVIETDVIGSIALVKNNSVYIICTLIAVGILLLLAIYYLYKRGAIKKLAAAGTARISAATRRFVDGKGGIRRTGMSGGKPFKVFEPSEIERLYREPNDADESAQFYEDDIGAGARFYEDGAGEYNGNYDEGIFDIDVESNDEAYEDIIKRSMENAGEKDDADESGGTLPE